MVESSEHAALQEEEVSIVGNARGTQTSPNPSLRGTLKPSPAMPPRGGFSSWSSSPHKRKPSVVAELLRLPAREVPETISDFAAAVSHGMGAPLRPTASAPTLDHTAREPIAPLRAPAPPSRNEQALHAATDGYVEPTLHSAPKSPRVERAIV